MSQVGPLSDSLNSPITVHPGRYRGYPPYFHLAIMFVANRFHREPCKIILDEKVTKE